MPEHLPNANATVHGLTSAEALDRLRRDGPNVVVPVTRASRLRRLVGPLADPMVLLLLVAAPTYLLVGETSDAVTAFVALVPVVAVGWLLEARAERTLDRLREMTAPTAAVVRDGEERSVPADEVVVGDLVCVREGDVVPADATLVELTQLDADEASLTGESLPVGKTVGDSLWAGTTVLSGRGSATVVATGSDTRFGSIGRLVDAGRAPRTPLQVALGRLVRTLGVLALVVCAAVMAVELARGAGLGAAVIAGVSLAIAAIPEEFSVVYTLYLTLGAWRLTQQRALVRRLPSVETLGSTTVICTDKTGTLTEGSLSVAAVWTPDDGFVSPGRHAPAGQPPGERAPGGATRRLMDTAVLACEPESFDTLDRAVLDHARALGIDVDELRTREFVTDWPFDPGDRYVTHVWADGARLDVAAKGAMEGILAHARVPADLRAAVRAAHDRLTADGLRVIAVAGGTAVARGGSRGQDEEGLVFGGLVAFSDPIREGLRESLDQCREAGIRVVMVTGDHPATAHAVVTQLGLPHESGGDDLIVTGEQLDAAGDGEVDDLVASCNVFARVRPDHKHLLVRALRRRGEVVAMTGDGVNDAPALREADIGVAMGRRGTAVARDAASIVLLDDNFATIVGAAREGRRIFDNLARAFAYLIAFHPPLLLGALIVPLLGRPLLLEPIHLVVLELLLHPVVSLVFQADPAPDDVMRRPPRRVEEALSVRGLAVPYAVGAVLAVVVVGVYLVAVAAWPEDRARALAFATLLAAQPVLLLAMRSPDRPFWRSGRPWTRTLTIVMAALTATTVAVVELPWLADLLHLEPFPAGWWLVVLAAAGSTAWSEPFKGRRRA